MTTATYTQDVAAKVYAEGSITEQLAGLPDHVAADQRAYDGQRVDVMVDDAVVPAVLRGDLYDLQGSGTGDPVVELVAPIRYRIVLATADLADALAHSAEGRLISTTSHPDGTLAILEVPSRVEAAYLETLLDADERVSSYAEQA